MFQNKTEWEGTMKILTFAVDGVEQVGVMNRNLTRVIPTKDLGFAWNTVQELLETAQAEELENLKQLVAQAEEAAGIPYEDVEKRAPIPQMRRDMICIGYNFRNHAQEIAKLRGESAKSAEISYPIYFSKRTARATGEGEPIPYVAGYAENLDCGVEVCVVIGKDALNITEDQTKDYIFGYTIANDMCDTRLNKVYTQPFLGKSIDGYMPVGPWIVTADEFAENPEFHLKLSVNGKTRQEGTTAGLVFSIPYIVSELTTNMTLKAGTMISTGSPANFDAGDPEKLKLWPGDVITCEIDGIGSLSNPIVRIPDREGTK